MGLELEEAKGKGAGGVRGGGGLKSPFFGVAPTKMWDRPPTEM